MKRSNRKALFFTLVFFCIFCYVYRAELGVTGINFFLFTDRLLQHSTEMNPVFMWALMGIFIGMVCGSIVAWKKYRLHPALNLLPIGMLALFIVLLFLVNGPLDASSAPGTVTEDAYRFVTIHASSSMPDYKSYRYNESNLLDRQDNTSWVENGRRSGIGEQIEYVFDPSIQSLKGVRCVAFRMKNGFCGSNRVWKDFNRLKTFYIYHNGNMVETATAADVFNTWEKIDIKPIPLLPGDRLTLHIGDVYAGRKRAANTAVTELVPVISYLPRFLLSKKQPLLEEKGGDNLSKVAEENQTSNTMSFSPLDKQE